MIYAKNGTIKGNALNAIKDIKLNQGNVYMDKKMKKRRKRKRKMEYKMEKKMNRTHRLMMEEIQSSLETEKTSPKKMKEIISNGETAKT